MSSYPDPYPINSQAQLDPRLLTAACALQASRMFLYRRNLSPACRRADRRDALERCVSVAKDTAHYVSRSMNQQPSPSTSPGVFSAAHMASWGARLRTMAPAFFCSHLWRCMLVLCFCAEYAAALTLLQASAAIGDMRRNNVACGRNLAFFLDRLIERLRAGASLEDDEEMLVYASADLQGHPDSAWAWTDSDSDGDSTPARRSEVPMPNGHYSPAPTSAHQATQHQLTLSEAQGWGGWEQIQATLTQLLHDSQTRMPPPAGDALRASPYSQHSAPPTDYPPPQTQAPPTAAAQAHLQPQPPPTFQPSVSPSGLSSSAAGPPSSRISIKDIM